MIGGFEFELGGTPSPDDVGRLLRLLRVKWPACILESADGAVTATIQDVLRNRSSTSQFFLYRDLAAKRSWDEHGLTEENGDAMISVIIDEDFIMMIVNAQDSVSGHIVKEILQGIHTCRNVNRLVPPSYAPKSQQVTI